MKIATRKTHARNPPRNDRAVKQRPLHDHDLPVFVAPETAAPRLDWERLMEEGVQPALVVGGERRWQGRRR